MTAWWELLVHKLTSYWLDPSVIGTAAGIAVMLVAAITFESLSGGEPRRYLARATRTDALYVVFYVGGFFTFFVGGPLNRGLSALAAQVSIPHVPALALVPVPVQAVILAVVVDGIAYWMHRWLHASAVLWAFHRVHHSQENVTILTNYRFHVVEIVAITIISFSAATVLGWRNAAWVPATLIVLCSGLLAHSGWNWSYGVLDRILISPRYHGVHHSRNPEHHDKNFGMLLSVWDRLFGTAMTPSVPPLSYGLPGEPLPESFFAQLVLPFRGVLRRLACGELTVR